MQLGVPAGGVAIRQAPAVDIGALIVALAALLGVVRLDQVTVTTAGSVRVQVVSTGTLPSL